MKKLMVLGAMMAAAATFADTKVATVDMMLLVRNHASFESNKKVLKDTERSYQKELESKRDDLEELQKKASKLNEEMRNPMLSDEAKQKAEKEIMEIQQDFVRKQRQLQNEAMKKQQDLGMLESRLLKAQAEDLKVRIAKFAEKEGYDLIVDAAAAIYAAPAMDVTDKILIDMNVDPKVARAKEKEDGNEGK